MGDDDRLQELEQRLQRLERRETAVDRSRRVMDDVMPRQTRDHLRNAGREQLLAVRTMLDHWIGRLGNDRSDAEDDKPSRETIRID
jgi:hypothetical protein